MIVVVQLVSTIVTIITWLVIIKVVLSYFMSPYHPIREAIDGVVEPMLAPIRGILPRTGMIDFSPIVLIILLQLVEFVLRSILLSI